MKIYISGKISGIEEEAVHLFQKAHNLLEGNGFIPVNPMTLNHDHNKSWENYMKVDIKALCDCEAIYMLENWLNSKGALIEHALACDLGLKVYYQHTFKP
jgi:hypothetical protein